MTIDPETVRERGYTTDELTDKYFVGPEDEGTTSARIPDEWVDEDGSIRYDARIEELDRDWLVFEYRDHEVRIANESFGVWLIEIDTIDDVAKWFPVAPAMPEEEIKARFTPLNRVTDRDEVRECVECGHERPVQRDKPAGFVDRVEQDHEATRGEDGENVPPTTIYFKVIENYQPIFQGKNLVDRLIEYGEETKETADNLEAAFKAAREIEKEAWDGPVCPECDEPIDHVVRRDGEGPFRCPSCDADLDDHIDRADEPD